MRLVYISIKGFIIKYVCGDKRGRMKSNVDGGRGIRSLEFIMLVLEVGII